MGLLEGRTWVPRTSDLTIRNCADQPNKKDLAQILFEVMVTCRTVDQETQPAFLKTAELIMKHPPSPQWTLVIISTIDPGNVIFQKDYVKPRFQTAAMGNANSTMIPSFGDFFQGLPEMQPTKNAGRISFVSKQQQQTMRVDRLQQQLLKARARMDDENQAQIATANHASSVNVTAFRNNPI